MKLLYGRMLELMAYARDYAKANKLCLSSVYITLKEDGSWALGDREWDELEALGRAPERVHKKGDDS